MALRRRTDAYEPYHYYEQRVYEGFPSHKDKKLLEQLNKATAPEKAQIIQSIGCPRLRYLGKKLLWLYNPQELTEEESLAIGMDIKSRWNSDLPIKDKALTWSSIQKVQIEIESVKDKQLMSSESLEQWKQFYKDRFKVIF